jgi:hypothetical protein
MANRQHCSLWSFRPPEEFPTNPARGGAHACGKPFHACFRSAAGLWHNPIAATGAMSVTLTNAEKQARYREHHLDDDGGKRRLPLFIDASTGAQLDRLAQ